LHYRRAQAGHEHRCGGDGDIGARQGHVAPETGWTARTDREGGATARYDPRSYEVPNADIRAAIRRPLRAVDSERESGQPAAGAQCDTAPGVHRPHGARRGPGATRATTVG